MNDFTSIENKGLSSFHTGVFNSRRIEAIELPSGDNYLFFVDQCPDAGEVVFDITKPIDNSPRAITEAKISASAMPTGLRVLTGCRTNINGMALTGLKWIGYKSKADGDNYPWKINPFIEIYSSSVSYNKATNTLSLYFWTNIYDTQTAVTTDYSIDRVAVQKNDGTFVFSDSNARVDSVRKVLCYAQGRFIKGSVNATTLDASDAAYATKECADYIPLFEEPVILHSYAEKDSKITDISAFSASFLPFDIKPYTDASTVTDGYAIYLPNGFWRRNDTKIYQNQIPTANTVIFNGSNWRKLAISEANWKPVSSAIPPMAGGQTDFSNDTIDDYCEIWAWVTENQGGGSNPLPWYVAFSDQAFTEEETGSETDYKAKLNLGTQDDITGTDFQTSMGYGLCIHVATLYRASSQAVYIHQLYHGNKSDYVQTSLTDKYLPYDMKNFQAEDEDPVIQFWIPAMAWIRNGTPVSGVSAVSLVGAGGDWYSKAVPTESTGVWAILREKAGGGEPPWYEDISNAEIDIVYDSPSYPTELTDALTHNAAYKIGRIEITESGDPVVITYNLVQYYHGFIKDGSEAGTTADILPYDLKVEVTGGETPVYTPYVYVPVAGVWIRNGEVLQDVPSPITNGWFALSAPETSQDVWAVLRDKGETVPAGQTWYSNISGNAVLAFVLTDVGSLPDGDTDYNQAYKIGLLTVTDGVVEATQYYHGIIKDFYGATEVDMEPLPFDLKSELQEVGSYSLSVYLPITGLWERNEETIVSDLGTGWVGLIAPSVSTDVWAQLGAKDPQPDPTKNWWEHIGTEANISVLVTDSPSFAYGAALKIGRIVISGTAPDQVVSVEQYYHGIIKDTWHTGSGVLVDHEYTYPVSEIPNSDSIEKFTVPEHQEGDQTIPEKEYLRIVGMDETAQSGSGHNLTAFPADEDDFSIMVRQAHAVKYLTLSVGTQVINKSFDTDGQRFRKYVGSQEDILYHLANSIVGVSTGNTLAYYPAVSQRGRTSTPTDGTTITVNSFEGLALRNNKLVAEYSTVNVPIKDKKEDGGGGGSGGSESSSYPNVTIVTDVVPTGGSVKRVCWRAAKKANDDLTLYFWDLPQNQQVVAESSDEVNPMPYDVMMHDNKLQMFSPIWRRNGKNIELANAGLTNGWLDVSNMTGDIWAVLEKDSGAGFIGPARAKMPVAGFIAGATDQFTEWYGTRKTILDKYFVTYDDLNEVGFEGADHCPYSLLHSAYATALANVRSLEYNCVDFINISTEQIGYDADSLTIESTPVIDKFSEAFKRQINWFNDCIYDLDSSDLTSDDEFPIYKYAEEIGNEGVNIYLYHRVFTKAETITIGAETKTAKEVLEYFISQYRYIQDTLVSVPTTEALILQSFISDVLEPLQIYAHAIQEYVKAKIDANLISLRTEVYKNHLYVLTGSTTHYDVGERIPDNLVNLGGTEFFFNEIEALKASIDSYIVNPTEELETSLTVGMAKILDTDYDVNSTREDSVYAIYAAPMLLPYYQNMYPEGSLDSLYEERLVKTINLGDPADFTVNSEQAFVVALLNKLAYCYNWEGHFYGKREALYSVITDLYDSYQKIKTLMSGIEASPPAGVFSCELGIGGGNIDVYDELTETGTWTKGEDNFSNANAVLYRRFSYSVVSSSVLIAGAKASDSPNVLGKHWGTKFNTAQSMTSHGFYSIGQNALDKHPSGYTPRTDLTGQEMKFIGEDIKRSVRSQSAGADIDDLLERIAKRENITEEDAKSIYSSLQDSGDLPSDAVRSALTSAGNIPISSLTAALAFNYQGNGALVTWTKKPAQTTVYRGTTLELEVTASWTRTNAKETEETAAYGLTGIFLGASQSLPISGTTTAYSYDEASNRSTLTCTLSWTVPIKDTLSHTVLGSVSSYSLNAVFYKKSNQNPFSIKTSPAHLAGTKLKIIKGRAYGTKYLTGVDLSDFKDWTTFPYSITIPGKVAVGYANRLDIESGWIFKEWQMNGTAISTVPEAVGTNWKLDPLDIPALNSVLTAVFEQTEIAINFVADPTDGGYFPNGSSLTAKSGDEIELNCAESPSTVGKKWTFQSWTALDQDSNPLNLFGGASTTTTRFPTVTIPSSPASITFKASFKEENDYDQPSDPTKYRIVVEVSGGDQTCKAQAVTDLEADIGTSLGVATSCLEGSLNEFQNWSCPDSDLTITDPSALTTDVTGNASKTFVVKAVWQDNAAYTLSITGQGLTELSSEVFTVTVTLKSGGVETLDLSSEYNQVTAQIDPATVDYVTVGMNIPTGYVVDSESGDSRFWTWDTQFPVGDGRDTNLVVNFKKAVEITLPVRMDFYLTGEYSPTFEVNSVVFPSTLALTAEAESTTVSFAAADYIDPVMVRNGDSDGYWKYTFNRLVSIQSSGHVYHSGYFDNYTDFETTSKESTATLTRAMFEDYYYQSPVPSDPALRNVSVAPLFFAAYFTKTWVPEAELPAGSLQKTITVTWDASVLEVNENLGSGWTKTTGNMTGTFDVDQRLYFTATVIDYSYEWGSDSAWRQEGIKIGSNRSLSFTVKDTVTLTATANKAKTAFVYVSYGPTDAGITASVAGSALVENSGNIIPSEHGYPVSAEVSVATTPDDTSRYFYLNHSNSNSHYVFEGIYDLDNRYQKLDASSINPVYVTSTDSKHYLIKYRLQTSEPIPITYKVIWTKDGIPTTVDGKSSASGTITGPDSVASSLSGGTATFTAIPNTGSGVYVSFTKFSITEYKSPSNETTENYGSEWTFTYHDSTTAIEVTAYFEVSGDGEEDAYPNRSVTVKVVPANYGKVVLSLSSPVVGTPLANSTGNPFTVTHNTRVTVTASSNATNYTFKKWTITQGGATYVLTTEQTYVDVTSDTVMEVLFEKPSSGGTGDPPTDPDTNDEDEDSNDEENGGSDDSDPGEGSDSESGTRRATVHIATAVNPDSSYGKVSPSSWDLRPNTKFLFTAIPNSGYKFKKWSTGETKTQVTITAGVTDMTLTAYFEYESQVEPPRATGVASSTGNYRETDLPWYAPRSSTMLRITTSQPTESQLQNSAALHIAKVVVINQATNTYSVSQYWHGERVDYIDYGDADMDYKSSVTFKSIAFNDGTGSGDDTNRKPARLHGFDESGNKTYPKHTKDGTSTDWKKYGILARKTVTEDSPSDGAELVYLAIPEDQTLPEGTNDRDVLKWNPKLSTETDGEGNDVSVGGWDVTVPIGEKQDDSSSNNIGAEGEYTLVSDIAIPEDGAAEYLLEKTKRKMVLKAQNVVTAVSKSDNTVTATKETLLTVQFTDGPSVPPADTIELPDGTDVTVPDVTPSEESGETITYIESIYPAGTQGHQLDLVKKTKTVVSPNDFSKQMTFLTGATWKTDGDNPRIEFTTATIKYYDDIIATGTQTIQFYPFNN